MEIKFLLKFGERIYLERLKAGHLYFSNALTIRYYEDKLFIKGQGDRLEGGSVLVAQDFTLIDNDTGDITLSGARGNMLVHYEPAGSLPIYCMFACFPKDCVTDGDGKLRIKLSEDIIQNILSHFPKADAVAIIREPQQFIDDVHSAMGHECKSDLIHYFHLLGIDDSEHGKANDLDYFKYLAQDTPPERVDGGTKYAFNADHVYRCLLCKDVFFTKEQEYRFVLPRILIKEPREFDVTLRENIEIQDLSAFFCT